MTSRRLPRTQVLSGIFLGVATRRCAKRGVWESRDSASHKAPGYEEINVQYATYNNLPFTDGVSEHFLFFLPVRYFHFGPFLSFIYPLFFHFFPFLGLSSSFIRSFFSYRKQLDTTAHGHILVNSEKFPESVSRKCALYSNYNTKRNRNHNYLRRFQHQWFHDWPQALQSTANILSIACCHIILHNFS